METPDRLLQDLTAEERAALRGRLSGLLQHLDKLENDPIARAPAAAGACSACDCDPGDGSAAKASFHFGKNLASV